MPWLDARALRVAARQRPPAPEDAQRDLQRHEWPEADRQRCGERAPAPHHQQRQVEQRERQDQLLAREQRRRHRHREGEVTPFAEEVDRQHHPQDREGVGQVAQEALDLAGVERRDGPQPARRPGLDAHPAHQPGRDHDGGEVDQQQRVRHPVRVPERQQPGGVRVEQALGAHDAERLVERAVGGTRGADEGLCGVQRDEVVELAVEADRVLVHRQTLQAEVPAGDRADVGEGRDAARERPSVVKVQGEVVDARRRQQPHCHDDERRQRRQAQRHRACQPCHPCGALPRLTRHPCGEHAAIPSTALQHVRHGVSNPPR